MKRTKQEPSLAGLLLIVTGMLLLSMLLLNLAGSGTANGTSLLVIGSAGLLCLGTGAALSARKKK